MKRLMKVAEKKVITLDEFENLLTSNQLKQVKNEILKNFGFDEVNKDNPIINQYAADNKLPFFTTVWYAAGPAKGYTDSLEDYLKFHDRDKIVSTNSDFLYNYSIKEIIDYINDPNCSLEEYLPDLDFVNKFLDLFDIEEE